MTNSSPTMTLSWIVFTQRKLEVQFLVCGVFLIHATLSMRVLG